MKFIKTFKDYQTEHYILEHNWKGINVEIQVSMQYHTFLKYWEAGYCVNYNKTYSTPNNSIVSWEDELNRKELRKCCAITMQQIEENPDLILDNLPQFYQDNILK